LKQVRDKFGGSEVSDDRLLMYYVVGKEDVDALRGVGSPKEYISAKKPLLALLQDLTQRSDYRQIHIRKQGMNVSLEKRSADGKTSL
jgi:hypothetical protein